jgi:hypothetical protein
MKKTIYLTLLSITLVSGMFAQMNSGGAAPMAALNTGDINTLTTVKSVNIIYSYSDLSVGAFRKEEDYLNKKCDDLKKKDPSACDKFRADWVAGRKTKFEPKFEELFTKYGTKTAFMSGVNYSTNNEITLEVHTVFIEPGFNIGIAKKPAFIDIEFTFKDKTGKALCVFFIKNAIGSQMMGFDFDVTSRLVESYAKAAKMLVGVIKKERKKAKIKISN